MYDNVSSSTLRFTSRRNTWRALIEYFTFGVQWSPISASSCGVMAGCSRGVLRPYHAHHTTKPSAGSVVQNNALRHPKKCMSEAINGGVAAAPSCNPIVCRPTTNAQRLGGNHCWKTPAETGNVAACDTPSRTCSDKRQANSVVPV